MKALETGRGWVRTAQAEDMMGPEQLSLVVCGWWAGLVQSSYGKGDLGQNREALGHQVKQFELTF